VESESKVGQVAHDNLERGQQTGEKLEEQLITHDVMVSAISGFVTGFLSGLVGLGGSELRIPFILYGLNVSLREMVAANLLISLFVSSLNFALRAHVGLSSFNAVSISLSMILGSLFGAFLGASVSKRFTERRLKAFITFILIIVLTRIVFDLFYTSQAVSSSSPSIMELGLAAGLGLFIGIVAGSVGVAGGEFQIPALTFLFGLPIKTAGTASQLISIPTIIIALLKHKSLGFLSKRAISAAILMGIPSVLGVLASLPVLASVNEHIVELAFASIILYTISRLLHELI
jgi:uncharacterized membrane protein YfcA